MGSIPTAPTNFKTLAENMSYRDIQPGLAGIYLFQNKVNGKCYVGQSIDLRKRIKHHISCLKNKRYDLPLYRALEKYGLHNFELSILLSFKPEFDDKSKLIDYLNELEIKYIDQYKGYTEGYNCTKGGDFGVLGLKFTEEQKKKVSDNVKELVRKGVIGKHVYMYNYLEKYYIYAWTMTDAGNITKVSRNNISRLCNNTYPNGVCSGFIAAFTEEELKEKINKLPDVLKEIENRKYIKSKNRLKSYNTTWYKGMTSFNKGKKMSEEQKEKIRNSLNKHNVLQYDLNMNLIKIHDCVHHAAISVNTDDKSIRRACTGKAKTCKGYIWKYKLKIA